VILFLFFLLFCGIEDSFSGPRIAGRTKYHGAMYIQNYGGTVKSIGIGIKISLWQARGWNTYLNETSDMVFLNQCRTNDGCLQVRAVASAQGLSKPSGLDAFPEISCTGGNVLTGARDGHAYGLKVL
jgi:hypothetical protein